MVFPLMALAGFLIGKKPFLSRKASLGGDGR
jgi:hypothetical protein